MELHPIMYVHDQYAERDFYTLFGFSTVYEGDEFPGFLAIRKGNAGLGLQRASDDQPAYRNGLRWQFEVETVEELEDVVAACRRHGLDHEIDTELGGDQFKTRIVKVRSPGGCLVWFEGPNEAA